MSSKYLQRVPEAVSDPVRQLPEKCGVTGCEQNCTVLQVVVEDGKGRERSGWWSDFAYNRYNLKDEFKFVQWIARCDFHALKDICRSGRSQHRAVIGSAWEIDSEVVFEHWRQLDTAAKPSTNTRMEERQ